MLYPRTSRGRKMTTNIDDIYKRYPEVKVEHDANMLFWGDESTYDPDEESCFDKWVRVVDSDTELYHFLYALSDYDGWLLKQNETTPEDYVRSEVVIKKLMTKHLQADLDEIWWISEDEDANKWSDFHRNMEGI